MIRHQLNVVLLLILLLQAGCINLQKVNAYASRSTTSLETFENLNYNFTRACTDKCLLHQLEKLQLRKTDCTCIDEKAADSVTLLLYRSVKNYFEGLAKLSGSELTKYKFSPLSRALKEGQFGEIKLDKSQVDSYSRITEILSRMGTEGYRKRKLAIYVAEANEPLKTLLDALNFTLVSNLSKRLDTRKQAVESYYFDLFREPGISTYEKKKIIEELAAETTAIEIIKNSIAAYGKGLQTIRKGHQALFENRQRMNAGEVQLLLQQLATDLEDIIIELNKLEK